MRATARLAATATGAVLALGLVVVGVESGTGGDVDPAPVAAPALDAPALDAQGLAALDPAAPDPTAADPTAPDPTAPDPTAPDPTVPDPPSGQGPIILDAQQAAELCQTRIPAALSRIDETTTRIGADAATVGSTAWLTARRDKARAAGHAALADRIQVKIDGRPELVARLASAKQRTTAFRDGTCGPVAAR